MVNILHRIPLIRHYARKWEFACFQKKWRKQNRHNRTVAMNRFPIKSVQVGKDTYGELHILSYLPETEFLHGGSVAAGRFEDQIAVKNIQIEKLSDAYTIRRLT